MIKNYYKWIAQIIKYYLIFFLDLFTEKKVFGNFMYRNFDPTAETATTLKSSTTWFSIGLRSDLFNWYFDY